MAVVKKALGKGLGALISTDSEMLGDIAEVDINKIEPNKQQPRKYFDEDTLQSLADSILEYGIIQPLILKEEDGGYYSIIAGERRWRAARLARVTTVPAIIKDYSEMEMLQIALIENIQRQDLNPIEEAMCFKRLIDDFFFSQDDVAAKIGKSRNTVSYSVNLLNLDSRVQDLIIEGKLSAGHGRTLLSVKDPQVQYTIAERILEDDLSIRMTEKLVKAHNELKQKRQDEYLPEKPEDETPALDNLENELKSIFGTKVSIRKGKKRGTIEIEYYSHDELDRLLRLMKKIVDGEQLR